MTKKELLEELEGIPDDYIICGVAPMSGEYYELSSVEAFSEPHKYYDLEDELKEGKLIVL